MGAIDHDAQAIEADVARQRAFGEFDVAIMHAVDAAGAPEAGALRETTVDRLVVSGNHVATWLTLGGETVRSGVPWQVEGCTVWEVCEGSITSVREYYDWSPLLRALGIVSDG